MRREKTNLHAGNSHRDNNYPVHTHTHTHLERVLFFFLSLLFSRPFRSFLSRYYSTIRVSPFSPLPFFSLYLSLSHAASLSEIDRTKIFFYFVGSFCSSIRCISLIRARVFRDSSFSPLSILRSKEPSLFETIVIY